MNKPVYLGLSILEICKTVMYGFLYGYIKLKYYDNANLSYLNSGSFVVNPKTEDIYKNITNYIGKRFNTKNYEVERALATGKNKKW